MDIYLTGKVENKDGQDVLMSAIAMDGKLFKLETPFEGEQTYHDVVAKTMKKTEDYMKHHAGIIKQMGTRSLHFKTDYLGDDVHEAINASYKDETINACRNSLAELLHIPFTSIEVDNLEIDRVKDTLMQRVFEPETEQTYHFKPDDLVICGNNDVSGFSIYARVVSVDKKENTVWLDKYQEHGEFSNSIYDKHTHEPRKQRLLEMELTGFYRPMTDEEILTFHEGMTKLLTDPAKSRKLDDPNVTRETYEIVGRAVENIRAAEKADDLDLEL